MNKFTVEYLNKLNQMQDQVSDFSKRKARLDQKMAALKKTVDTDLREKKEAILDKVTVQR